MIITIVTFSNDAASMTQKNSLLPSFSKTPLTFDSYDVLKLNPSSANEIYLLQTDSESVHYESLDEVILEQTNLKSDLIVFATKHQSKSGIHSLSCHAPGNWAKAEYGGNDSQVCISPAKLIKEFYLSMKELNSNANLHYEVIIECTHHGPYIKTPCIFIEIGSDEESWKNSAAGDILAKTILEILPEFNFDSDEKVAIGFGGMHHAPQFVKRLERDECLISHVCPKYMIETVTEDAIESAILNSIPSPSLILFDWKGMGSNKSRVIDICENMAKKHGLEILRTKDL